MPQALVLAFALALLWLASGCRVVRTAADVPGQTVRVVTPGTTSKNAADPVELEQNLLRFADGFLARMIVGIEKLKRGTNDVDQAEALRWKTAIVTETCSIASGPNAVADVLDMTVFVTMLRTATEEHWQPHVFGESATPLLESCRIAENEIWQLAGSVLKPDQQTELRQAIENWHRKNPLPESVLAARAIGLAAQVVRANQPTESKPNSVFSLLNLDPLSGLDPATREIAQTRMFAERALYVSQKMPTLLRWQTELLAINAVNLPSVQQLVTNTTQLTASADRVTLVVEQLPAKLSAEREEIVNALESQEKTLSPLAVELRQTLEAGTQMSASLDTTLKTFDALMKRFGVGEPRPSPSTPNTNSQPFRVLDYARTAEQVETMAKELTELLATFDQTLGSTNLTRLSAQAGPVVEQAKSSGKDVVDHAFWRSVQLAGVLLVVALIYRFFSARITSASRTKGN